MANKSFAQPFWFAPGGQIEGQAKTRATAPMLR